MTRPSLLRMAEQAIRECREDILYRGGWHGDGEPCRDEKHKLARAVVELLAENEKLRGRPVNLEGFQVIKSPVISRGTIAVNKEEWDDLVAGKQHADALALRAMLDRPPRAAIDSALGGTKED